MKENTRLLVIRFSAMGDVAMCVPVLRRLVICYPELKITVLTKPLFAPLFEGIPNVSVFPADVKNEYKGVFGLYKLARELKKRNFDAVADLHEVLRTKILRFFFACFGLKRAVIDKGRDEKKALIELGAYQSVSLKTTHERYAAVFEELGYPVDLTQKTILSPPQLSEKATKLIGKSDKKRIGIAPFAAHDTKMYPLDLMEEVIKELSTCHDCQLVLFGGGKKEKEIADQLAVTYENLFVVIGAMRFEEELNLISNLDLMLSMDSGNGHLAAAYGVPVVTIWGNTHPYAGFVPFGQPKENQLLPDLKKYPKIPTSIYGNKKVKGYENVMRSIPPKKVMARIIALL